MRRGENWRVEKEPEGWNEGGSKRGKALEGKERKRGGGGLGDFSPLI